MLRLYTLYELVRELSPEDFQHILTPESALEKAAVSYDLDYRNYTNLPLGRVPRTLSIPKDKPYIRAGRSVYDPVYDDLEMNLMEGWIIGLDTDECWDDIVNPFYIDADSKLIFDNEDPFFWVLSEFQKSYQIIIRNQDGRKPTPTERFDPSGQTVQHAQATKIINSKAAGRLLAAGGIYNGNVEGFRKTAEQLGGDAPAGYHQVLNETTKGVAIAAVSVAAGLGIGRMDAAREIGQLNKLAAQPEKLTGGEARAQRFSQNWPSGDLGAAVNKFSGSDPTITITKSGKQIFTNPKTGVQVVEDLSGRYFRIHDPSLPGKRTYLDLDGNIPNNKVLDTEVQVGRTQSEYNEVTHFKIYGGQ